MKQRYLVREVRDRLPYDIFDDEFSDIIIKENFKDIERYKQANPKKPQSLRQPPPLPSFDKINQERIIKQQNEDIVQTELPKQRSKDELERQLLLYEERLRLCHERLRHEQLENERLHHQYELREQADELGHNDLSFGQDQLNQHEELERERRNKSKGGSRKKSKSKKSKKSRRYKRTRNIKKK